MSAVMSVVSNRELLWNFTLRELRTKYRRSFLGWTWSMLNPLATLAIYWFVFGVIFNAVAPIGSPSGLDSYALFLLCGLIPWNFFALMCNLGIGAITANAGLVRRVAFPREVLVFANVLHACVQYLIELTLLCIILLIAGSPLLPWLPLTLLVSVFLAMFGSGFALALGALAVYFRDLAYLWTIVIQVWFFATPIIYPPSLLSDRDDIPEWVITILELNPTAVFVRVFRALLYDAGAPATADLAAIAVGSTLVLAAGWALFLRLAPRFAEEV
ncbi:MAG: ABC transporter permease [Ilumatobacteraceae bacterium]